MNPSSRLRAVLTGGTIAGTLDILFALTFAAANGVGPVQLLQNVASGLLVRRLTPAACPSPRSDSRAISACHICGPRCS